MSRLAWVKKAFLGEARSFTSTRPPQELAAELSKLMAPDRFLTVADATRAWIGEASQTAFTFRPSVLAARNLCPVRFLGTMAGLPQGGTSATVRSLPHLIMRAFGAFWIFTLAPSVVLGVLSPVVFQARYASLAPQDGLLFYFSGLAFSLIPLAMLFFGLGICYGNYRSDVDPVWVELEQIFAA